MTEGQNDFESDRSRLSGLHFAQDAMKPHERETLHLAEQMLRRLNAVLALHYSVEDNLIPDNPPACAEDADEWPCATVRAITGRPEPA